MIGVRYELRMVREDECGRREIPLCTYVSKAPATDDAQRRQRLFPKQQYVVVRILEQHVFDSEAVTA